MPRPEGEAALFARWRRDRDPAAHDALVERFLPLAQQLAGRYYAANEREDLNQVAVVGLLKAIERYDPGRGIAFASYAVPTIFGELKRYFRDLGWAVRVPRHVQELAQRAAAVTIELTGRLGRVPTVAEVAERCGSTVERVLEARATTTAHHAISLHELGRDVSHLGYEEPGYAGVEAALDFEYLLAHLERDEQAVIRLRYGQELLQREIGERLGMSQMSVSRTLSRALDELATLHELAAG